MGTNYYFYTQPPCECCKRPFEGRHIGKSSDGWVFSLHVYPRDGIETLEDWRAQWSREGGYIANEYSEPITPDEIMDVIQNRAWHGNEPRRHQIDGHCIGYGPGSWDYIVGEFE